MTSETPRAGKNRVCNTFAQMNIKGYEILAHAQKS